jgi:hypothetical protein
MPRFRFTRVSRLSRRDVAIVAEAAALVLPVEVGLRCLSLDALLARLGGAARGARPDRADIDVERVARLVDAVGGCYPPMTCLKKSLILLRILRTRGFPAELRLGVRKLEDDFKAHAWVECDGRTLLDGGMAPLYATLPLTPAVHERAPASRAC